MTRPLRSILGEMMREARIGDSRFTWDSCDQEDWCRSADVLLRLAAHRGIEITHNGIPFNLSALPSDVYSIIGHNPGTERIIRRQDDTWSIVARTRKTGEEKTVLTFDLAGVDIDADLVISGNPTAQQAPAILTRLAAATLIRTLHAETV